MYNIYEYNTCLYNIDMSVNTKNKRNAAKTFIILYDDELKELILFINKVVCCTRVCVCVVCMI